MSLLPPLLAIVLAFVFKEVISSLVIGIFTGCLLLLPGSPGTAFLELPNTLFINALSDRGHAGIVLFSLMLGGMVGVMANSGGMSALVKVLGNRINTRRGGQLTSWVMGLIIFFDDYANTLLVGNTLRPYTDKLKISRAKLAYIVDSTAAPVASIAVISTWVGFEVGLLKDAFEALPLQVDAYIIFLTSIPYSSYSIFALLMVASIAFWNRDIGAMHKVETLAQSGEDVTTQDKKQGLEEPSNPEKYSIIIALIPIVLVVSMTFGGLYLTGKWNSPESTELFEILGNSDSAVVLLSASFTGLISAFILSVIILQKSVNKVSSGIIEGIRSMMPAMIILILAWSMGEVCDRLGTADFIVNAVSDNLSPFLIPTILFLVSGLVAFSTGTSWGAMAILIPVAIPIAFHIPMDSGVSQSMAQGILYGSVGAVLAGATFGDHCSPISDTTILSSMASGCNHIDHVRTQMLYAVIAGVVAIAFGYLPSGLGIPPWIGLTLGAVVIFLLPRYFRKYD